MGKPRSELLSGLGTAFEVLKRIVDAVRAQGGTDEDVRALLNNKTLAQEVAKVIIAGSGVKKTDVGTVSLIPSGWTVVEDVPATDFSVEKMEFISFLKTDESFVDGVMMRKRAALLQGNLGLADAPRILTHLNRVKPEELRGCYVVLPGTVLRDSDGDLHVPYLGWDGGRCVLCFDWLSYGWNDNGRVARCK